MWYSVSRIITQSQWSGREHNQVSERGSSGYGLIYGPTARLAHILRKLLVIFGTIASFSVLMQNFHQVTQGSLRRSPPLPQCWKGPSSKSDYNALEEWWILRSSSTSRTTFSMEYLYLYCTPEPPAHSWWSLLVRQKVRTRRSGTR